MLEVRYRFGSVQAGAVLHRVVLTWDERRRFRFRTRTTAGEEIHVLLDRGAPLCIGEVLGSGCGRLVIVEGSEEPLVVARCADYALFARACYHLGNRHVRVQIGDLSICMQPDHVIEEMLAGFGCELGTRMGVFEPEPGAYARADGATLRHGAHEH
jgi:urease accessory protein